MPSVRQGLVAVSVLQAVSNVEHKCFKSTEQAASLVATCFDGSSVLHATSHTVSFVCNLEPRTTSGWGTQPSPESSELSVTLASFAAGENASWSMPQHASAVDGLAEQATFLKDGLMVVSAELHAISRVVATAITLVDFLATTSVAEAVFTRSGLGTTSVLLAVSWVDVLDKQSVPEAMSLNNGFEATSVLLAFSLVGILCAVSVAEAASFKDGLASVLLAISKVDILGTASVFISASLVDVIGTVSVAEAESFSEGTSVLIAMPLIVI
jgi:hypothetical protein